MWPILTNLLGIHSQLQNFGLRMVVVVVFVLILHHQFYSLQGTQLRQGMCILLLGVEHK